MIEVLAGLVPGGTPDPAFTRRWHITSREWYALQEVDRRRARGELFGSAEALAKLAGEAQGYALLLMLQPERFNWVRTDWVWM